MTSKFPLIFSEPLGNQKTRKLSRKKLLSGLTYGLVVSAIAISFLDFLVTVPGGIGIILLCLATAISWSQYQKLKRHRWRRGARVLLVATVSCLVALWWVSCLEPAHAQFFQNAQDFFGASFPESDAGIDIVFNALRALYILYLAVSFIGVINAVRQDEDWQTVARTPALVVVVITLADVLTGLITG
jgi:hypothetical protein